MFNNQKATVLFRENYYAEAHVVVNQGGSHSGKTFAIQQVLFCRACEAEKQVVTVVGQDIPNLKAGVLRDALSIYNSSQALRAMVKSYNKTDRVFEFHNGSAKHFGADH
jgi:phage terminase large subunit